MWRRTAFALARSGGPTCPTCCGPLAFGSCPSCPKPPEPSPRRFERACPACGSLDLAWSSGRRTLDRARCGACGRLVERHVVVAAE